MTDPSVPVTAPTCSDEALMSAVRNGDLSAFTTLVERHQRSAWTAAYRFLGDSAEAEDIAQEAFLKIFEAAARYEPTASFRTYLYRVITRLCIDHVAKKKPNYRGDPIEGPASRESPQDQLNSQDCQQAVQAALDRLVPNQKMAVVLRYFEGLGYVEIAAALETSPKAVERLLARARESLEPILAPLLD